MGQFQVEVIKNQVRRP